MPVVECLFIFKRLERNCHQPLFLLVSVHNSRSIKSTDVPLWIDWTNEYHWLCAFNRTARIAHTNNEWECQTEGSEQEWVREAHPLWYSRYIHLHRPSHTHSITHHAVRTIKSNNTEMFWLIYNIFHPIHWFSITLPYAIKVSLCASEMYAEFWTIDVKIMRSIRLCPYCVNVQNVFSSKVQRRAPKGGSPNEALHFIGFNLTDEHLSDSVDTSF